MFKSRQDAGQKLARRLRQYSSFNTLLLALPRGGVPVAYEIATRLCVEMDIYPVRKIASTEHPELAVGALAPGDTLIFNHNTLTRQNLTEADCQPLVEREKLELSRRLQAYRGDAPLADLNGRIVIVVDDGLATGASIIAALRSIRKGHQGTPAKLIVAVPVAAPDTLNRLQRLCDEIVCLEKPMWFSSVSQFYQDFEQVTDAEVMAVLEKMRQQED